MLLDDSVRLAERAKAAGVDVNTRAIELPDDAALIEELCALERSCTGSLYTYPYTYRVHINAYGWHPFIFKQGGKA